MKVWHIVIAVLMCLMATLATVPTQAKSQANSWNKYPIPEKGGSGDWVLTSDVTSEISGITAIAVALDGTIYAATEEIGVKTG